MNFLNTLAKSLKHAGKISQHIASTGNISQPLSPIFLRQLSHSMNMNLFDLFGAIISLFRDQMDTIIISYVVKNTESMKSYTNSVEVDVDSLPS